MSMFSEFYAGDLAQLEELLHGDVSRLSRAKDLGIRVVDFYGSIFPEDFDRLLFRVTLATGQLAPHFNDFRDQLLDGVSDDQEAEHQAYTLQPQLVEILAQPTDADLQAFSNEWNEQQEAQRERRARERPRRWNRQHLCWLIPFASTVGILLGRWQHPRPDAGPGDLLRLAIFWGLGLVAWLSARGLITYRRSRVRVTRKGKPLKPSGYQPIDLVPYLVELRELCQYALRDSKTVVYYWSL